MDAPLFIYNRSVVKTLPHIKDGLPVPSVKQYEPIYDALLELVKTHVPLLHRHLIPYMQFLFSHEDICQPKAIPEFSQSKAFSLGADTVIYYRGTTYFPTAWTLRGQRMVPYELINSTKVPPYNEMDIAGYRQLWRIIEKQHNELISHVTLRQLEAAWCGAKYGEGAFRVFDAPIMRNWLDARRKSFALGTEQQRYDTIEFMSAYIHEDLEDYKLEYYVNNYEE